MALIGCDEPKPLVKPIETPVIVPAELRNCPAAPPVPGAGARQSGVARYVVRLHNAHGICRERLKAVDRILTAQEDKKEDSPDDEPSS